MGRESSYMKYHPKCQDIPSSVVKCIYNMIEKVLNSKMTFTGAHSVHKELAPFFETTAIEAKILTNPTFYRRVYRLNYDHEVLRMIMIHYSF